MGGCELMHTQHTFTNSARHTLSRERQTGRTKETPLQLLLPHSQGGSLLPPQEAAVSGGPLAWESSDVSLAAYYLVILGHGPPLPSPMAPAYAASLIAEPAARLLKSVRAA